MSKYTTEVRYICETSSGLGSSVGGSDIESTIQNAIPVIFDFEYPIFDPDYKNVLETKILKHYYFREIAHETVGRWKFRLNTKLNEIMPFYNQLYKSQLLKFNPLYDTEMTKERTGSRGGNEVGSSTNISNGTVDTDNTTNVTGKNTGNTTDNQTVDTTNNKNSHSINNGTIIEDTERTVNNEKSNDDLYSETPQGAISNLKDMSYLTNARLKKDLEATTDVGNLVNDTTNEITSEDDTTLHSVADGTKSTIVDETRSIKDKGNSVSSGTSTINNSKDMTSTEEYLETVKGKQGSKTYAEMLKEYRSTFLNIDMLVIDELAELFFTLW